MIGIINLASRRGSVQANTIKCGLLQILGPLHTRDREPMTISFRALSLAEKVEPVKFASHLGGGHTRRVCAGTGVGTGGYPVTDPAHTIPIPERDARCQGLLAGGSCRIWLRSSPQSCLLTATIIQRYEADLG